MSRSEETIKKMKQLKEGFDWYENGECAIDNGFAVMQNYIKFIHKEKGTIHIITSDMREFPRYMGHNYFTICRLFVNLEKLSVSNRQLLSNAITYFDKIADNPDLELLS